MKNNRLLSIFIILILTLVISQFSFAGEQSCLSANARMTNDMESAASASNAGDMCRAADMMDSALYWAMKCETECAYSKERLRKAQNMKSQLISALAKLVQLCGH
ncbi:MAG: hypothetical protein ABIJ25_11110 [Pseudomonadota bacterium]